MAVTWIDRPRLEIVWRTQPLYLWIFLVLVAVTIVPFADARNHYRVTSVLIEPYFMINPKHANHTGNDQFMGYIPDLMRELSELVGFHYRLHAARDGNYGIRQSDRSWDGMIGELLRDEADIAAAPLYATNHRKRVVSFSQPFLNVQATILLSKKEKYPGIRSAKDLLGQSRIQYGTLNTGVIVHAFKHTNDSSYQAMWQNIKDNAASVFTSSNIEGIDRVRKGGYAFILPSTIGEYISRQTHCDLKTLDRFLMRRDFALAVSKKSKKMTYMLPDINEGLDLLQSYGRLQELYSRWWLDKDPCGSVKSSSVVSQEQYTSPASAANQSAPLIASCLLMILYITVL